MRRNDAGTGDSSQAVRGGLELWELSHGMLGRCWGLLGVCWFRIGGWVDVGSGGLRWVQGGCRDCSEAWQWFRLQARCVEGSGES